MLPVIPFDGIRLFWRKKLKAKRTRPTTRKSRKVVPPPVRGDKPLTKEARGKDYISVISRGGDGDGPPLEVRNLPSKPKYARTFSVRNSNRWIVGHPEKGSYTLPYIDLLGRISSDPVFGWQCDPRQYVATIISTVARKATFYARRHNADWRLVAKCSRDILRASAYYAITKNIWFWDRTLYFLRNLGKCRGHLLNLTVRMVKKLDENKRFVYGQASSQANWLLFRVVKPRDKSSHWKYGRSWRSSNGSAVPPHWLKASVRFVANAMSELVPLVSSTPSF